MSRARSLAQIAAALLVGLVAARAQAEPYFAVQLGLKCSSCHVNPTGGGMRNAFGNTFGQTILPKEYIAIGDNTPWTGELNRWIAIGGNLRAAATATDIPKQKTQSAFDLTEMRVYLEIRAIPERLSLYVDQKLAPGGSSNSEAYARLWSADHRFYIKAGQMYLPYGLRLQDDTAFIRQIPGINFATPDRGVEFGLDFGPWSAQVAVSNGTAGGPETDTGKQISGRAEYVAGAWRAGISVNFNDADAGKRKMANVFAGLRTGPVSWLAEADIIRDDAFAPRRDQLLGLIEADWKIAAGHNLKFTAEYFDPDRDVREDQRNRLSIVWEYTPMQFAQIRLGVRRLEGIPQNQLQNQRNAFLEINGYF